MRISVGNLVKVIKKEMMSTNYSIGDVGRVILLRGEKHVDVRFGNNAFCIKNINLEVIEESFNKPQSVDLSKVKVGEKYVIGDIYKVSSMGYLPENEGDSWVDNYYKVGDIVQIVEGENMTICFSKVVGEDESDEINTLDVILYPYTEPSQAPQQEPQLHLGVIPENENVSSEGEYTLIEVTHSNIEYARRCYNGYLRVAKVFNKELDTFVHILNEDDRMDLLEKSLWWVDGAIQDKICSILGIDINRVGTGDTVINILFEAFKDMEEFDVIIGRLKVEGIIK